MKLPEPSIATIFLIIWRHAFLIIAMVALTFSAAIAVYLKKAPNYETTTYLLVGEANPMDPAPGTAVPAEFMSAQARIAQSDDVLRQALADAGTESDPTNSAGPASRLTGMIRGFLKSGETSPPTDSPARPDAALGGIRARMSVGTEQNSNILTLSFRDTDPARAASMTNALARAYIDRQSSLLGRPGVVDFLRGQTRDFDDEVGRRAAALRQFSERENIYSVEEERSLLLRRESNLDAALSATRITLAGKAGEKEAMSRQLALLRPVARSPFAAGFVATLSEDETGLDGNPEALPGIPLGSGDTPPLLMIKMFQEVMTRFQLVDSEIRGLGDLERQQGREIEGVRADLARLATSEGEYERLKRDLELATFNAETLAKRTVEEEIESDLPAAKLSNVRVIQPAVAPREASSPKAMAYATLGIAAGAMLGVALAFARATYALNRPRDEALPTT